MAEAFTFKIKKYKKDTFVPSNFVWSYKKWPFLTDKFHRLTQYFQWKFDILFENFSYIRIIKSNLNNETMFIASKRHNKVMKQFYENR